MVVVVIRVIIRAETVAALIIVIAVEEEIVVMINICMTDISNSSLELRKIYQNEWQIIWYILAFLYIHMNSSDKGLIVHVYHISIYKTFSLTEKPRKCWIQWPKSRTRGSPGICLVHGQHHTHCQHPVLPLRANPAQQGDCSTTLSFTECRVRVTVVIDFSPLNWTFGLSLSVLPYLQLHLVWKEYHER